MDPALLRERELFKKKALSTPTVEKKHKSEKSSSASNDDKSKSKQATSKSMLDVSSAYKSLSAGSNYKFGVLAKIVRHLKSKHLDKDDHPLSLEELLDETNQLDIGTKVKQWLLNEALAQNPKVEVNLEGRYTFKPPYKLKDRKAFLKLLKQHDLKGLGGVMLDDIQESLPNCEKVLKILANEIIYVQRPIDKKKVLFYNDKTANFNVDEEFVKLWRSVAVENLDDEKIEEYLDKQGIKSMQDQGLKKIATPMKRKKAVRKKTYKKPRDNEHLADVLESYEDK